LAVGWCQVTPRTQLPWLAHARYLAPMDDIAVWSVSCFYIRRGHRGQGVAAELLDGAVEMARRAGAPALEGYPVDTDVPGSSRNVFTGTAAMFGRAGFTTVAARTASRPIMRRDLTTGNHKGRDR
jgi:GNAT superfamily N-acetyltransferase